MFTKFIKKIMYPHSYSSEALVNHLRSKGAVIGENVYFYTPNQSIIDAANAQFLEIGDNVQFTAQTMLLEHDYSFAVLANKYKSAPRKQKRTKIGSNVFIGVGSIILMGADIGDNVIIGAGSVVSGKVESDSVYAGNPARKVCTLDEHFEKNKAQFIASAKCYVEGFKKKNGRLPETTEMIAYRALLTDDKGLQEYFQTNKFIGISEEAKQKMSMTDFANKFSSVEELMNYED